MMLTEQQRLRLFQETVEFSSLRLEWHEHLDSEREPKYTARVLLPQYKMLVTALDHHGLVLRSDGATRPQPVRLSGRDFYPDLAVNYYAQRELAIEAKFVSPTNITSVLTTAIGQAVSYTSGGYNMALIVAVSTTGHQLIDSTTIGRLNDRLQPINIALVELHA